MKKDGIIVIVVLLTVTIASILMLIDSGITGMSPTRVGKATITFREGPPPPPPPPPSAGGGAQNQVGCCNQTRYDGIEYICRCFIEQYGVVRLQPSVCCKDPTNEKCQAFCYPVQQPAPPPPAGICPIEQTCGTKCCKPEEKCTNNKCTKELQPPPMQLLEPPEIDYPTLVAIPYTTYAFPWWYFAVAILALLILSFILIRKTMKTQEPPKQPSKPPEKPKRKRRKRK